MGKKFTKKELVLRSRAEKRRFSLKFRPTPKGVSNPPEKINQLIIRELERELSGLVPQQGAN